MIWFITMPKGNIKWAIKVLNQSVDKSDNYYRFSYMDKESVTLSKKVLKRDVAKIHNWHHNHKVLLNIAKKY